MEVFPAVDHAHKARALTASLLTTRPSRRCQARQRRAAGQEWNVRLAALPRAQGRRCDRQRDGDPQKPGLLEPAKRVCPREVGCGNRVPMEQPALLFQAQNSSLWAADGHRPKLASVNPLLAKAWLPHGVWLQLRRVAAKPVLFDSN